MTEVKPDVEPMKGTMTFVMKKVGYIPMTADLFHVGHLNIIARANQICNYVVIGLLADELVKKYKGMAPVIPFEERKAILECVMGVNKVVKQTSLDFSKEVKKEKAMFVISADPKWEPDEEKALRKVEDFCMPVIFRYYEGQSTTKIKNDIVQRYVDKYGKLVNKEKTYHI